MISDENRTFDANLVAGDGRNRRKSPEIQNCYSDLLGSIPSFSGQIFENQGY
jgi:hypothetical protein